MIVKSQGDGYMVVFSTPELAVGASLDIQRALSAKRQRSRQLRRTPIRVRIGLHTGTAIEREGDYFGSNVAMAARVAALADGGEILVTDEIAEALAEARRPSRSSRRTPWSSRDCRASTSCGSVEPA